MYAALFVTLSIGYVYVLCSFLLMEIGCALQIENAWVIIFMCSKRREKGERGNKDTMITVIYQ